MSHPENDKLYETFLETLEPCMACPYCGDIKATKSDYDYYPDEITQKHPCCSEVHVTETYIQDFGKTNEVLLYDSDIKAAFNKWLEDRG